MGKSLTNSADQSTTTSRHLSHTNEYDQLQGAFNDFADSVDHDAALAAYMAENGLDDNDFTGPTSVIGTLTATDVVVTNSLSAKADAVSTHKLGCSYVGTVDGTDAIFAQKDYFNDTQYAFKQKTNGQTHINTGSVGDMIYLNVGNTNKVLIGNVSTQIYNSLFCNSFFFTYGYTTLGQDLNSVIEVKGHPTFETISTFEDTLTCSKPTGNGLVVDNDALVSGDIVCTNKMTCDNIDIIGAGSALNVTNNALISGDLTVTGTTNLNGTINLGDGVEDVINVNGIANFDRHIDCNSVRIGWSTVSANGYISHKDHPLNTEYSLRIQGTDGEVTLNTPSGTKLRQKIGGIGGTDLTEGDAALYEVKVPFAAQPSSDSVSHLGRAKIGYNALNTDSACFSHEDYMTSTGYALKQEHTTGNTILNTPTAGLIEFRVNDAKVGEFSAAGFKSLDGTDATHHKGRLKLGYDGTTADEAVLSHEDNHNTTDYALRQDSLGATKLNCKLGQTVDLCINNVSKLNIDATEVEINHPLTVTGNLVVNAQAESTHTLGKARIGQCGVTGRAAFAFNDGTNNFDTTSGYAISQTNTGAVLLNAPSGQGVGILGDGGTEDYASFKDSAIKFFYNIDIASNPPASASATGTTGMLTWDSGYLYVCTATNTWKRAALATW